MDIWSARKKSFKWLNNELKIESWILQQGFDFLGKLVKLYEKIGLNEGESENGQFCRIISITLAKSSHLLLGSYSLILDGVAQEAGALLRPIIETHELLVYIRLDKSRIYQVIDDKLPSPGNIGKAISGNYQGLREHLNKSASHFSYKITSIRHLFDKKARIRPIPDHSLNVLRTNLQVLITFQIFILREALNCLLEIGIDANALIGEMEEWHTIAVNTVSPGK